MGIATKVAEEVVADGSDNDSMYDDVLAAPAASNLALEALEDMGFADSRLNSELLAANGGDLESTTVQLLQLSQWSEQRTTLLEMGVEDSVQVAQLLLKHSGNANLVVKELLSN